MFRSIIPVVTIILLIISCTDEHHMQSHQHGVVDFEISCNDTAQAEFETGLGHLHHMMYSQARPRFEAAAASDPDCAMAYWGIAMTGFQPLWAPSSDEDLSLGRESIRTAIELGAATEREQDFIHKAAAYYEDPGSSAVDRPSDFQMRLRAWMEASRDLHDRYPDNVDAAAFYALSEISYAMTHFSPHRERDFKRELRAGELMERFLENYPEHPGLFHYLIHAYDSSDLAHLAEEVARQYDQLAPDTPHALHMPSHIFVRLGYWEDTAEWNERSADAAKQNPFNGLVSMHYPHALDYMMYAYLQLEDYGKAAEILQKVREIGGAQPHFATAYGIAAAQARYVMEQHKWEEAATLRVNYPEVINWENYPGASALFNYARGIGAARSGDLEQAEREQQSIKQAVETMREEGNVYWAYMTDALSKAVKGWLLYERGEMEEALALLSEAANLEESMDKHPITPGEVFPVRELHAEMLKLEGQLEEAREAFDKSLERTPNRRNALKGLEESVAGL